MKSLNSILLGVLPLMCGLLATSLDTSAQIVSNPDFADNISQFIYYPGYSGPGNYDFSVTPGRTGLSNAPILNWSSTNNLNTGENPYLGNGGGSPFAPNGYGATGDPSQFAFVQHNNSLTQVVNLGVGTYVLSFESAPRNGDVTNSDVTVSNGSVPIVTVLGNSGATTPDFAPAPATPFVVTTAGAYTLSLNNIELSGDLTEDFYGVNITKVTTPEPGSFALVGLGLGAALLLRRRARA